MTWRVTLKRSAFGSLQRLSMRFYSARHTGEMMTRLEPDASDIALLFHIIAPSALTDGLFLAGSLVCHACARLAARGGRDPPLPAAVHRVPAHHPRGQLLLRPPVPCRGRAAHRHQRLPDRGAGGARLRPPAARAGTVRRTQPDGGAPRLPGRRHGRDHPAADAARHRAGAGGGGGPPAPGRGDARPGEHRRASDLRRLPGRVTSGRSEGWWSWLRTGGASPPPRAGC